MEQDGRPGAVRATALRAFARLPRGVRVGLVRRFTPNFTVGALCFLEHDGRILVLRQRHRHGWTLPGGLLDRGEEPAQTAAREVAEETGLRIDPGDPLITVVDGVERRVDVIFHVPLPGSDAVPPVTPRSEAVAARWLPPDQLGDVDRSTGQALAAFIRGRERAARPGALLT